MDANRRTLLLSGMAATAAHGAATAHADALEGRMRCDEPARAAAADDFGHIVHDRPKAVLRPQSAGEVAAAIRWASARGLHFAAQGRRHSVFGRGMAADGIVAEMSELRTIHDVQGDRVVVDAGATWREMLAATLPRGLAPPVLPEYLELSVGGTLVVGGVGGGTARFGLVSGNVLALDVVTGTGHEVTCSAACNAELFDAVRAGLGQVAVITRATLRLVPAPRQVRRHLLFYRDLGTMLRDQRLLAADNRFDAVMGAILAAPGLAPPGGSWGARIKVKPRDDLYLQSGIYEVNPTLSQAANGFKLGTSGATGVIVPAELGWQPRVGAAALPGHYRIGGYYDTSLAPWLGSPIGGPSAMARGRWGFYLQPDQTIYRPAPDSVRNLTLFAVFGYAGPGTALLQTYWQLGLVNKGTFAGRDHDTIGLAVNSSSISSQLIAAQTQANALAPGSVAVQSAETTIELNYRAQLSPWFSLMPNVQYVLQPNGVATIPNALVLGLQAKVTF